MAIRPGGKRPHVPRVEGAEVAMMPAGVLECPSHPMSRSGTKPGCHLAVAPEQGACGWVVTRRPRSMAAPRGVAPQLPQQQESQHKVLGPVGVQRTCGRDGTLGPGHTGQHSGRQGKPRVGDPRFTYTEARSSRSRKRRGSNEKEHFPEMKIKWARKWEGPRLEHIPERFLKKNKLIKRRK